MFANALTTIRLCQSDILKHSQISFNELCTKAKERSITVEAHSNDSIFLTGTFVNIDALQRWLECRKRNMKTYSYFCAECSFKCNRSKRLEAHLSLHKSGKIPFSCSYCAFQSFNKSLFISHQSQHSQQSSTVYDCDQCSFSARNVRTLRNHQRMKHRSAIANSNDEDSNDNEIMDSSVDDINLLEMTKNHQMQPATTNVPKKNVHLCPDCDYTTEKRSRLARHQASVHSTRTLKCTKCSKNFGHEDYLNAHMIRVHAQTSKSHNCQQCKKLFSSASHLREHMETHSGSVSFLCDVCGQSLKTSSSLRHHKRMKHVLNRSLLTCHVCSVTFSTPFALKRHRNGKMHLENVICHSNSESGGDDVAVTSRMTETSDNCFLSLPLAETDSTHGLIWNSQQNVECTTGASEMLELYNSDSVLMSL